MITGRNYHRQRYFDKLVRKPIMVNPLIPFFFKEVSFVKERYLGLAKDKKADVEVRD